MFDFKNWFWEAKDGRIYSSAAGDLVSKTNAGFKAFKETNGFVTPWPSDKGGNQTDAALAETLAAHGLTFGLDGARAAAGAEIDTAAENARLKYLTPGMGQGLTYQAKAEELRRYDADTNPVKADYPYLAAEVGITGPSLTAVADAVRSAMSTWSVAGVEIERTRLKAKADIVKASSVEQISAVLNAIVWP